MKRVNSLLINLLSLSIVTATLVPTISSAGIEKCPKESIHCIYNTSRSLSKWIKVLMLPRNLTMVLCLSPEDVLYLEKDDVDQDGYLPGTVLTWEISQCVDEQCSQSRPLGIDHFRLLLAENHYDSRPRTYGFAFDASYGENCTFQSGQLRGGMVRLINK